MPKMVKKYFLLKSKELVCNYTAKILTRCRPEWIMLIDSLPPLKNYWTCMLILWILFYIYIILDIFSTMPVFCLLPLASPFPIFWHKIHIPNAGCWKGPLWPPVSHRVSMRGVQECLLTHAGWVSALSKELGSKNKISCMVIWAL